MEIRDDINDYGIVYSPNKYRETEGTKDLFNKSHSYSYAVLCFQTAFLKKNHPLYFFKSLFNLNIDKTGAIGKYILNAREFGIEVIQPNINRSQENFSVYDGKILFGISAISGIGKALANAIIDERNSNGNFKGFTDLSARIGIAKSQIISLIKSGAIPTNNKRKCIISYLRSQFEKNALNYKPVSTLKSKKEMFDVWGINIDDYKVGRRIDKNAVLKEYNKRRKAEFYANQNKKFLQYIGECEEKYLQNEQFWEFESLQIFLSENPFNEAYDYLRDFREIPDNEDCTIVGVVARVQKKKMKNGRQFAFVNIYSMFGLIEAIVWSAQLKRYEDLLKKGGQIAMKCVKENETQIICEKVRPYDEWLEYARRNLNEKQ